MLEMREHFANAIKQQLLGGFVLECVTANYNNTDDESFVGLVFMHSKTREEKTLYFYDTDKVNYHIEKTHHIGIISSK
ncbi:MAG: hypothetical protein M0P49_02525 [Bacilli bacterium]|nr:hypothetical protein [Bacilli bacterium]